MRLLTRHAFRFAADLCAYGGRTGRWWLPVVLVVLVGVTMFLSAAKTAVPVAVYTLF
jgi:hypothetical protein